MGFLIFWRNVNRLSLSMKQLTENEKRRIKKLTEGFISAVLKDDNPRYMCFNVCYPLSLHLENNGIESSIKSCWFNGKEPHYFLTLGDEEETIIDPTIRQFENNMPGVYIGKKTENYGKHGGDDFDGIYKLWLYPLLHDGWDTEPFPELIKAERHRSDIRLILKIGIRSATFLSTEIEQLGPKKQIGASKIREKYFEAIYRAVITYSDRIEEFIEPILQKDFFNLLIKAKNYFHNYSIEKHP